MDRARALSHGLRVDSGVRQPSTLSLVGAGFPEDSADLWPQVPGQVISLLVSLAHEEDIPVEKQKRYLAFARQTADKSIAVFSTNGLFRTDGLANHCEAMTGADNLLCGLLQLYCDLARPDHPLRHNNVNW